MPIQCKPVHYEGDLSSFKWQTHHKINTSLLMLREWTYTASSRDALGNTSPSALEISLGRGFCTPREISWASGDVFPNTSLLSAVNGYNAAFRKKNISSLKVTMKDWNNCPFYTNFIPCVVECKMQHRGTIFWPCSILVDLLHRSKIAKMSSLTAPPISSSYFTLKKTPSLPPFEI